MDHINTATAKAVRDAIHAADRTEQSVAAAAHITPSTWQRRINARTAFTVNELSRVASALGVKLAEIADVVTEKMR